MGFSMGLCPRLGRGGGLKTGCHVLFIFRWTYNWAVWGKGNYKCVCVWGGGGGGESTSRMTVLFTITEKKHSCTKSRENKVKI